MSYVPNHQYATFVNGQSFGETLGISADEIGQIVDRFYSKVRNDAMLGPVFEKEMTEDWDHHLVKMNNFWNTVMFGKALYKGNPIEVHRHVNGINRAHFEHWLDLFKETLIEVCPNETHVEAFYQRANNMAWVMTAAIPIGSDSPSPAVRSSANQACFNETALNEEQQRRNHATANN